MDQRKKGIVFALSAALLLSLCLPPAGRAAETPQADPSPSAAAPVPTESAPGGSPEPPPGPDQPGSPPGEPPEGTGWQEAATLEELEALLFGGMMRGGGQIRVTGEVLIPAGEFFRIWPTLPEGTPLVVDLGVHTLTVEGTLAVTEGIEFTGAGGEEGLIRIKPGGSAVLNRALFTVTEPGGCAVRQETGGSLNYTPHEDTVGEIRIAPRPEAEAASFEALAALLEECGFRKTGGLIRATADLTVPAGTKYLIRPSNPESAPLTVDLGGHTLAVEGDLTVHSGVELTGAGGETGLVRVRPGGRAAIASAVRFTVTEEGGYALWQEEGSILSWEPEAAGGVKVHFAQRPVALPHAALSSGGFTPVALVRDGQTLEDALPAADGVQLYRDGAADMDAQIPVTWEPEPYRAQLDGRERVLLTGSYPDADAFQAPVCLVTFQNGNPATVLNCYGAEGRGILSATVQLALARPELGCRFEWSRDGRTWLPAGAEETPEEGGFPVFHVTFSQEEPPAYPYYLAAVVEDQEGVVGYSDVVVIERADAGCGSGGNRGGGTDITDPPGAPAPDPAPPQQNGGGEAEAPDGGNAPPPAIPEDGCGGELTEPDPVPVPPGETPEGGRGDRPADPAPEPPSPTQELPPGPSGGIQGAEASPAPPPEPVPTALPSEPPETGASPSIPAVSGAEAPSGGEPEPSAAPETVPAAPNGSAAGPGPQSESPVSSVGVTASPGAPGALSLAAGCTAVAAVLGAAGLCLYPKAGKRIRAALKRLFKP